MQAGHRRIGVIGYPVALLFDPRVSVTIGGRVAGIESALARAGVQVAAKVEHQHWEPHHGYTSTQVVLDADPSITALICMNDRLAFGAYQALQGRGLTVPDDISIASFDDDEIAGYLRPGLTTARIPYEEMGRVAMTMLLRPEPDGSAHRMVPMPLQVRVRCGHCSSRAAMRSRGTRVLESTPTAATSTRAPPSASTNRRSDGRSDGRCRSAQSPRASSTSERSRPASGPGTACATTLGLVRHPLQDPAVDEGREPGREDLARETERLLELAEVGRAHQGVADDHERPLLSQHVQRTCDGAALVPRMPSMVTIA